MSEYLKAAYQKWVENSGKQFFCLQKPQGKDTQSLHNLCTPTLTQLHRVLWPLSALSCFATKPQTPTSLEEHTDFQTLKIKMTSRLRKRLTAASPLQTSALFDLYSCPPTHYPKHPAIN